MADDNKGPLPWKELIVEENYKGPEGNVWIGCRYCGIEWSIEKEWIYREKIIVHPKEVMNIFETICCRNKPSRFEYRCSDCFSDYDD